uniref:Integrator complex subunit 4 n=1 Tax=Cyanistes caeruleus TaxID=156563 RepID=A0A8C0U477_CYACU
MLGPRPHGNGRPPDHRVRPPGGKRGRAPGPSLRQLYGSSSGSRCGVMAAHLKKRVYEEFTKVVQQQHEDLSSKKLRLTKPSKSAALHVDLCKATSPADALQYLLQFARKPVEVESVEGVVRILLEHYYKVVKLGAKHACSFCCCLLGVGC